MLPLQLRNSALKDFSELLSNRRSPAKMVLSVSSLIEGYNKPNGQDTGIYAMEPLATGDVSVEFSTLDLMTKFPSLKQYVRKLHTGELQTDPITPAWLRSVPMSEDIYSQNCIFELAPSRNVRLRITKSIQKDEPLIAWYSDEISSLIGVNFLSPINIKGNNCYVCHMCNKSFPSPHPLKLHISTACERYTQDALWMRLHYTCRDATPLGRSAAPFLFSHQPLYPSPISLFFPRMMSPPNTEHLSRPSLDQTPTEITSKAAAQIETLVSNMGTSKQGHLCIYCGKVYSRKYGLKIHIRTHTGFKPLKCKFCLRPFGDPSNLNKHLRLHIKDESNYKCHLCNKVVARRRDLQRHMETKHTFPSVSLTKAHSAIG